MLRPRSGEWTQALELLSRMVEEEVEATKDLLDDMQKKLDQADEAKELDEEEVSGHREQANLAAYDSSYPSIDLSILSSFH